MKMLQGRQTGKTTKLIKESCRTGAVIIVPNYNIKYIVMKMATHLNCDIPVPLTISEIKDNELVQRIDKNKGVLVDNLESCLSYLLDANIEMIAIDELEL